MHHDEVTRVLNLPIAQDLLSSHIPARLAFHGRDGYPRVLPIAFYWDGSQIVCATTTNARKVPALEANPRVALTIDSEGYRRFPPHVLLVRGSARLEVVDGVPTEYVEASRKITPPNEFPAWEAGVQALYERMVKITIEPEWAKLLDFETTIPSNVQEIIEQKMRQG